MSTTTSSPSAPSSPQSAARPVGDLRVVPFGHPQGCRTYLIADPSSGQALALDVHLDFVTAVAERVKAEGWTLPYVMDTHTHADHPSGSSALAQQFSSTRIAHELAHHRGVARHPKDGETLHLGDVVITVRHAPGHTPDHIVLIVDGALFCGDTLLIGGVARTDFLGGDAGTLFDSLQTLLAALPDETLLYPGHDYAGRTDSTLAQEKRANPWLAMRDRSEFVRQLSANPPPRPANMDALLELNREGVEIPTSISAAQAVERVNAGGAGSVIDVRFGFEVAGEQIPGARHVDLSNVVERADEIRATPAPRLLLCRTGQRAEQARVALTKLGIGGLSVIDGGIVAFRRAGGTTELGRATVSLERQVRIAAGTLVLTGALLGFFVNPNFLWLSAFVGAGLIFAGITDTCGMGMMLARMPWNRTSGPDGEPTDGGTCAANLPPVSACAATPPSDGGCAATPPGR